MTVERLSLDRCREILDAQGEGLIDEVRLERLRDDLYQLAELAIDAYVHQASNSDVEEQEPLREEEAIGVAA